ncbi:MAG: agmatinase [Xanthobacteraceae bacterium]
MKPESSRLPHTDNAVFGPLRGGAQEPTYGGVLSFMRRRYSRDLNGVDAVVWGIPFDAATSNRPGARFGPQAIRRASAIFDGDPQYPFGIDPFASLTVGDYGDCGFEYARPLEIRAAIKSQAAAILEAGVHLMSLGGDHFVTFPLLEAHAARHGPLALVQFDAHQDTWDDDEQRIGHGSFITRAIRRGLIDPQRSIQIGIRTHAPADYGVEIIDAAAVDALGIDGVVARIRNRVGQGAAYLSFDIDCLDPAFAPGTGTPVSGGLTSREAFAMLAGIADLDWRGMDVVEVAPAYDHADITAIAAATVVQRHIGALAQKQRPR